MAKDRSDKYRANIFNKLALIIKARRELFKLLYVASIDGLPCFKYVACDAQSIWVNIFYARTKLPLKVKYPQFRSERNTFQLTFKNEIKLFLLFLGELSFIWK